jgi:hypothetical protein
MLASVHVHGPLERRVMRQEPNPAIPRRARTPDGVNVRPSELDCPCAGELLFRVDVPAARHR